MAIEDIYEIKKNQFAEQQLREAMIKISENQKQLADSFLTLTRKFQELHNRVKKLEEK